MMKYAKTKANVIISILIYLEFIRKMCFSNYNTIVAWIYFKYSF